MTAPEFQFKLIDLQDSLMRFAYRLTNDKDNAKDLVQETNLKAITYREKYENDINLKAWTFTIMKNTFINFYHKNTKENTFLDSSYNQYQLNRKIEINGPESQYFHSELSKTIEKLQEHYRIPFQMHISGFKYKEIADQLNLNIGTVKSRIFLSRKQLMHLISL